MSQTSAYEKAVALLARRDHFRRQLEQKLARRGYPEVETEAALSRLEEMGYLDDPKLARSFVVARQRREPAGRRRLAAELVRRGVDFDVAQEALQHEVPEDDRQLARQSALRWQKKGGCEKAALGRYLDRRGFTSHAILGLLEEFDRDGRVLEETGDGSSLEGRSERPE